MCPAARRPPCTPAPCRAPTASAHAAAGGATPSSSRRRRPGTSGWSGRRRSARPAIRRRGMPTERRCRSSAGRSSPSSEVSRESRTCLPSLVARQQVPHMFGAVDRRHGRPGRTGRTAAGSPSVVDGKRQQPLVPRISCSSTLITPPWLNTATVSSWIGGGDDVVDRRAAPAPGTRLRRRCWADALGQSRPLLGVLRADLLDRDVGRQVAVVFGEAVVDLDVQAQRGGDRFRGLDARRCGLLTTRVIGNLASASGRRATCARPRRTGSGRLPGRGSLRSGNACRTRSNCTVTPYDHQSEENRHGLCRRTVRPHRPGRAGHRG